MKVNSKESKWLTLGNTTMLRSVNDDKKELLWTWNQILEGDSVMTQSVIRRKKQNNLIGSGGRLGRYEI
jgi:hypothetical protein